MHITTRSYTYHCINLEVLPFPVGVIAGVVIILIIAVMLIAKLLAFIWSSYQVSKKIHLLHYSNNQKEMYNRRFDAGRLFKTETTTFITLILR